jgi:hypothetical protein
MWWSGVDGLIQQMISPCDRDHACALRASTGTGQLAGRVAGEDADPSRNSTLDLSKAFAKQSTYLLLAVA